MTMFQKSLHTLDNTDMFCRMKMDILGVAETFWDGNDEFSTNIPGTKDSFKVLCSGGDKKRRGVGVILRGMIGDALMHYETISDRIMLL